MELVAWTTRTEIQVLLKLFLKQPTITEQLKELPSNSN